MTSNKSGGPWENLPPRKEKSPRSIPARVAATGWLLWLGGLAGLVAMVFALDRIFPGVRSSADTADVVQTIGILALISSGLLFAGRAKINWRQVLRYVSLWLIVGGVLMLGYAWQEPLKNAALHLRSQVLPGEAVATGARELTISESDGGSYRVFANVNGTRIRFLVDTGASDIVLSPSDARRAGIDPETLKYDRPYATANGIGYGATVTLDRLEVGAITFSNVRASVQQAEMGTSLLGMTFLSRLKSYTVQDRKLVLRW
jgi:aspartyl protease family protein